MFNLFHTHSFLHDLLEIISKFELEKIFTSKQIRKKEIETQHHVDSELYNWQLLTNRT